MDKIQGWLEAAGRDRRTFGVEQRIDANSGTPDEWRAKAEEWRALGATHFSVNTMRGGLQGADAHIERLRQALSALRA